MNDEIKAILADLNLNVYETKEWKERLGLSQRSWKILLDYITNLQEENERLEKRNREIYDGFLATQEELSDYAKENERLKLNHKQLKDIDKIAISNSKLIKEKEDYKLRIEKAVEYVEEAKEQDFMWTPIFMKELLDILNGRSDKMACKTGGRKK